MIEDLLSQLIAIPSVSGHENRIGQYLIRVLRQQEFTVTKQKIGTHTYNIFAERNPQHLQRAIAFYGHMDTVLPTADWDQPYLPETLDDTIIGLGAYDMKAGIAAFLEATQNSAAYIKIFLAVEEETDSFGGWQAVQACASFFNDVELVISAEPNFDLGLHGITIGRTGRVVFQLMVQGKATHVAQRDTTHDAIYLLQHALHVIYEELPQKLQSPQSFCHVRQLHAEANGMSICGEATCELEIFISPPDSMLSIESLIRSLLQQKIGKHFELYKKVRRTPYLEGYSNPQFPYQQIIANIIRKHTGHTVKYHTRTSVGDDNVLASLGLPVITWGPNGGNAHMRNEWVDMKSVQKLTEMYHELLAQSLFKSG